MKIGIVGLGLIGGSFAQGLSSQHHILGIDLCEETLNFAFEKKWIHQSYTKLDEMIDVDVLVLALYPQLVKPWLQANQGYLKENTIIMDTSGVKTSIIDEVMPFLREDLYFIGAHPMAGKEKSGIKVADCKIFHGANMILVETKKDESKLAVVNQVVNELNFGYVSSISKEEHDEMIGFLSQLTHVIAISLMNTNDHPLLQQYSGDSFRDLTRIAAINESLWAPLFLMNKKALLKEIDSFMEVMQAFKKDLIEENVEQIKSKMISSTNHRMKFDKKVS
ncbi:MAG: prephenate dehydrogenase [Erysipelotrichaceae bacterium]